MRHYETGVIIAPNLSEEEIDQQIRQMTELIAAMKGNLRREERWGKRKLAYPIKKFNDGYYLFLDYEAEPAVPAELERRFRQSDQILRYLTVRKGVTSTLKRKKKTKETEEVLADISQLIEAETSSEKEARMNEETTK
ncbi:MAG: 30S ribosomal protein S6 [Candidatus Aminicenantes bacterium]|nr:30S ribosomal protein S6 [Candidatus Aminicenantes bacterium]